MRELEIGEPILIEDYQAVAVWRGRVARAGGNLLVVEDERPPPVDLKPNAPVRICFSEERWLTKVRGRVLEREGNNLKLLIVGPDERIQRRTHVRVAFHQTVQVSVASGSTSRVVLGQVTDISEGGFQLRTETPLTVGESVQFTCCLNGADVQLSGQVVRAWQDGAEHVAGVRALGMSAAAHGAVARLVIKCSLPSARGRSAVHRGL